MKKIYLILFFTVIASSIASSQNKHTKKADKYFDRLEYIKAAEEYEKLVKSNKADDYTYTQLANSYYLINNTQEAEPYFRKVAGSSDNPELLYSFSQTLKANGKIEESNQWMEKFASLTPQDTRAIEFKKNPNYLSELTNSIEKFKLELHKDLQSDNTDFGGVVVNGKIYFTSARNTSKKKHGMTREAFLDIYQATFSEGTVTDIESVKGDVNTKYHEGMMSFSPDGERMYFDRNDYYNGKYKKDKEGINQLKIFYATLIDGRWKDINSVPFNNSQYSVGHPAVSHDGKTLYFVSDMPGGFGDSDIYKVAINEDGSFGDPENLGNLINTEAKEVFPYISTDGTLYFSSNGHLGLGGLDVFYSKIKENKFIKPINVGTPINSPNDDFAFVYNPESKNGFVSSNRIGNLDNIFTVTEICTSKIHSIVLNQVTKQPLLGAEVALYDANKNVVGKQITDNSGQVTFDAACDQKYLLHAVLSDYEPNANSVTTNSESKIATEIYLKPIEKEIVVEDRIVLNPIPFDFDKYEIKPEAGLELDRVVTIMKTHGNMKIKVEGHTDSRGSMPYNQELSERRAAAIVQYIISKGIDQNRLSSVGFGKSKLEVDCGVNCTEEEHAKNRRSNFIILEK